MHGTVVAAVRRIQVDQELDVEASHLPLQDVGDGVPLVLFMLPLPTRDVGTPEEEVNNNHHCSLNSCSPFHVTSRGLMSLLPHINAAMPPV